MSTSKRLYKLMTGNKRYYICALIATVFASVIGMLNPIIFQVTTDVVLYKKPLEGKPIISFLIDKIGGVSFLEKNLWICGLSILVITIINGIFSFIQGYCTAIASESMAKKLKDNLYNHIQNLPYDYHVKSKAGDLIQRCTSDVETVRRFLSIQLLEIVRIIVTVVFVISIMLTYNIKLTILSLVSTPIVFIFAYIFFRKSKAIFKEAEEKEGELSTVLQENLSGVRVVRAFGRERYEMDKYQEKNQEFRGLIQKMITLLAVYWSVSDFICFSQIALVLVYGVYLTFNNIINLGVLILFTSYSSMLIWPIRHLGKILSDMGKMQVALDRIYEVLDTPEEEETKNSVFPSLKGDIVFENVCFKYPSNLEQEKENNNNLVLNNMSFTIKSGETVAILGTTGSGKSTMMLLLLRLYDYNSGSIKINGVELKNINKKHLRKHVGIVLQEPFLYSKTIKNNIEMARKGLTNFELIEATQIASVHHSISDFEKGYDTIVGEKGVTLSGGQKQRIAIARTIVKNSSVLIFDDSLSAVDTETDAQIREALREKQKGVTTLIISQRITTLMEADKILVVEDGKLTEVGTHNQLVNNNGLYSRIWDIQNMMEDDFINEL